MDEQEQADASVSRREFVAGVAALSAVWLVAGAACTRESSWGGDSTKLVHFSPAQAAQVDAITARILPSDDGPGAREAKVIRFLERQLDGPLLRRRPAMQQGALLIDKWAQKRFGRGFAGLEAAQQDEILGQLARAEIPVKSFPQAALFRALHSLTLEGYLADPSHGGNDGEAGWRAVGFTAPGLRHAHH